jgi:hypothetical protein
MRTLEQRQARVERRKNRRYHTCMQGSHERYTEERKKRQREGIRGVKDEDCPTIVPGSRTEQVVIGSLLGDGSILDRGRFSETHCCEQKEMVFELARLFKVFWDFREVVLMKNPSLRIRTHSSPYHLKNFSVEKPIYSIFCPRFPIFYKLREQWYPNGKKIVPEEILDKIGPQALAWWYLGDGTYSSEMKSLLFCSEGFSSEDNEKLIKVLVRFGFSSAKITQRNRIRLISEDSKKFLPLVAEYIVPSMRYKLGLLEPTYKTYNLHHYDPEPMITERMLKTGQ